MSEDAERKISEYDATCWVNCDFEKVAPNTWRSDMTCEVQDLEVDKQVTVHENEEAWRWVFH